MWTTGSLQTIAKVIAYDDYPERQTVANYFRSIVQNDQPQHLGQKCPNKQKHTVRGDGVAKETARGGDANEPTRRSSQPNRMGEGL